MDNILKDINENTEIEIRLGGISNKLFEHIYNLLLNSSIERDTIEHSLNIYVDDKFKKIVFDKDKKHQSYFRKTKIAEHIIHKDKHEFKIVRSKEEELDDSFSLVSNNILFRFKKRASFILTIESQYRIDMTITRMTKNSSMLTSIRTQLFKNTDTFENFLENISNISNDIRYEIEIEFLKSDNNYSDYDDMLNYLAELLDSFSEEIKNITTIENKIVYVKNLLNKRYNITPTIKSVTNNITSLTKNLYRTIYPPINYYIVDKKDGYRCLLFINMNNILLITETKEIEIDIVSDQDIIGSVLDGELIDDEFHAFDIMKYGSKELVWKLSFGDRIKYLTRCIELINKENIILSNYTLLESDNYAKVIKSYKKYLDRDTNDGLILTSPYEDYNNTKSYKWKPQNMNTIDFLVLKCPDSLTGLEPLIKKEGLTLYILSVGITNQMMDNFRIKPIPGYDKIINGIGTNSNYRPVQYSSSFWTNSYVFYHERDDLNLTICELLFDNYSWDLVKVREDRKISPNYFGNNYVVAENTLINFIDPLTFEDLHSLDNSNIYFKQKSVAGQEINVNNYNRFVINEIFKKYIQNSKFVIDLASGRGADLFRYSVQKVNKVLFIEKDKSALSELMTRKYQSKKRSIKMQILIHNTDLTLDKDVIMNRLVAETSTTSLSASNIVCNFAIHYMCGTLNHMTNICDLISELLQYDGHFIMTTFNGEKVFDLLKDKEVWSSTNGVYRIKKLYKDTTLKKYGQYINVKLPFDEVGIDEPLCNINAFITIAKRYELEVIDNISFSEFLNKYKNALPIKYHDLKDEDIEYIDLYQVTVFRKIRKSKTGGRPRRLKK